MQLNCIKDNLHARKKKKRVARGIGSGSGKTATRGHKGQKSRSGVSIGAFEGGQLPIYKRMPKRGFTNIFKTHYQIVNLSTLQEFYEKDLLKSDQIIDKKVLLDLNIISKSTLPVKILSDGDIKFSLQIKADKFSRLAVQKINNASGKILEN